MLRDTTILYSSKKQSVMMPLLSVIAQPQPLCYLPHICAGTESRHQKNQFMLQTNENLYNYLPIIFEICLFWRAQNRHPYPTISWTVRATKMGYINNCI